MRYEFNLTHTEPLKVANLPFNARELRIINNTSSRLFIKRGSSDTPSETSFDYVVNPLQIITLPASFQIYSFWLDIDTPSSEVCTVIFNSDDYADIFNVREVMKQELKLCANGTTLTPVSLTFNPVVLLIFNNSDGNLYIRRGSQSEPSATDYDYLFKANTSGSIPVQGIEYAFKLEGATNGCVVAIFVDDYAFSINTLPSNDIGSGGGSSINASFDVNVVTSPDEYSFVCWDLVDDGTYDFTWKDNGNFIGIGNPLNHTFLEGGDRVISVIVTRVSDSIQGYSDTVVNVGLLPFTFTHDFTLTNGYDIPNLSFVCQDYALGTGLRASQGDTAGSVNYRLVFALEGELTQVDIEFDNTQVNPLLGSNRISVMNDNISTYNDSSWGNSAGTNQTYSAVIPSGEEPIEVLEIYASYPPSSGTFKKVLRNITVSFNAVANPFI